MSNIFSIPSNFGFFDSFLKWISLEFASNPQKISDLTVIFPNRRSCREFERLFSINFESSVKPPKFKAIADISSKDFYNFFPSEKIKSTIDEINKIQHLNNLDYLFFLSEEVIKAEIFGKIDFSQALSLAESLKNLFDDIERNEIDIEKLYEIDDSKLSQHRQFTLDFLREFYVKIKSQTIKKNIFNDVALQNFIIQKFASAIEEFGLSSRLIIAGSTGSIDYGKKLIKAIFSQKNGHVILYGLNKNYQIFNDEKDAQFILNELLNFIQVQKNEIKEIIFDEFLLCDKKRIDFISCALLPSEETHVWNSLKFDEDFLEKDFTKNFSYFEASNEIEEARIVANKALQAFKENKKTAIIVNSKDFSRLIKTQLKNLELEFNDTRSLDLSESKLINFILLITELIESNFESATLLAVLKHQYNSFSCDEKNLKIFEIEVLRNARNGAGIDSIQSRLRFLENETQEFFSNFYDKIKNLQKNNYEINLSSFFEEIINVTQDLSSKNIEELLEDEEAKDEISELFLKIKSKQNLKIKFSEISEFFIKLFSHISYFEKSPKEWQIQIISPIEVRLLNFDLLIITSLNHGEFPQIQSDNWLGKKIRKDLDIDLANKKYGQNAYDFCNYLSNESVILTRSKSKNGSPTMPSPFILRLEILLKKIGFSFDCDKKLSESKITKSIKNKLQSPKVPLKHRPQKLAITDIAKLISDPYQIYVKKILCLKELNKIDYEPNYKEFGSFIHKALEEFVKNNQSEKDFLQNAQNIFYQYFLSEESKMIWWPKFENIFRNFALQNRELVALKNFVEISAKIRIKNVLISAKIDRISIAQNGEIEIFDYKTGQIPAKKNVFAGHDPQLTLYGLTLLEGEVGDENFGKNFNKIKSLNYWKLSAFRDGEIKNIAKDDEILKLIEASKTGVEKLLQYYEAEENCYKISLNQARRHEYSHLERIF